MLTAFHFLHVVVAMLRAGATWRCACNAGPTAATTAMPWDRRCVLAHGRFAVDRAVSAGLMYCAEMAAKEKAVHETRWLNVAWVLLLVATAITHVLGRWASCHKQGGWFLAGLEVLTVGSRGVLVIQVFLEMRHYPVLWRWLLLGWLALVIAASAGLFVGADVRFLDEAPAAA